MLMIGYVDGVEVKFDFYPPDKFKAIIPKHIDGKYILQLHAVDEAGNETYYSNIFIKIDFKELTIRILPQNYSHQENNESVTISEYSSDYSYNEIEDIFLTKEIPQIFTYKELI